jgi:molybdate transport system substrate-binding protein
VKILGLFPEDTHPLIVYLVAVLVRAQGPSAQVFVDGLKSSAARRVFEAQGFSVLTPP